MTRGARMFRSLVDRLLRRFYEGPKPPRRYFEEVRIFRHYKPLATAAEWERFVMGLTSRAYQEGWIRGYEWAERSWEGPGVDPDRLAEAAAHDWSLADQDARWAALLAQAGDPKTARENAEAAAVAANLARQGRLTRQAGRRER